MTQARKCATRRVSVLTVDDRAVFRRAVGDLIAATPGFNEIGQAESGAEALELARALRPDLVLLDVRMDEMDGLETARRLMAFELEAVVVLISLTDAPEAASALGGGVAAHVRKQDLSTRTLRELWDAHGRRRDIG